MTAAAPTKARRPGRPAGAFTQHRRFDALRALLQRHPAGLSLYELAQELEVTPRSMRRYLAEVRKELDLLSAPSKPGGPLLWRLAPSDVPRKVEVRRTQAYALLAARRLFEPLKGSTLYEEIDLAAQKLLGVARRPGRGPNAGVVADARLEERFLYLPFAPKDYTARTEELDDLFQAVADLRPLSCRYLSGSGMEERITIHPYAMVLYKDAIYAVGLHLGKGEIRTFSVDRMRDTECHALDRFALPEDFSVDQHFQGQFGIWRGGAPTQVVIEFEARVAEFVRTRRIHASQELVELEEGRLRLSFTIGDLTEVTTWVLGFGETARVVSPPDLAERVRSELRGALALYERGARRARK